MASDGNQIADPESSPVMEEELKKIKILLEKLENKKQEIVNSLKMGGQTGQQHLEKILEANLVPTNITKAQDADNTSRASNDILASLNP